MKKNLWFYTTAINWLNLILLLVFMRIITSFFLNILAIIFYLSVITSILAIIFTIRDYMRKSILKNTFIKLIIFNSIYVTLLIIFAIFSYYMMLHG